MSIPWLTFFDLVKAIDLKLCGTMQLEHTTTAY